MGSIYGKIPHNQSIIDDQYNEHDTYVKYSDVINNMAIDITENKIDKKLRDSDFINYVPNTGSSSSRGSNIGGT